MTALQLVLSALGAALLGCALSIAVPGRYGRTLGFLSLLAAGALGCAAAVAGLRAPVPEVAGYPAIHVLLRIDPISAFFVGIIAATALLAGIYGLGSRGADERRTGRTAASAACAIALASLLVCVADDVLLFLFAWELIALGFYWAIVYAGTHEEAERSGYVTLVVTHVAGACLIAALLILAHRGGGYSLESALAGAATLSAPARGVIFVLLLIGFGAKFGMLPMQVWLPYGYSAAPASVAALMAGGALNAGFYGLARFVIGLPGGVPIWWAIVALALGALGAFFGIAWAMAQRDMRRLAAYSSVENGGIILAAFGVALAGRAIHLDLLVGLGLAAAFMQIAAHALAKTTLFLGCSTIADRCGTLSFESLGGLAKSMPVTTAATLVAALSLAALPPMAGFAGEWLILESLMQAFRTGSVALELSFALCGATIGVAAGIAVVAFVKLVGIGLLGSARSPQARAATETPSAWKRLALVLGALAVLSAGIFARSLLTLAAPAIDGLSHANAVAGIAGTAPLLQPAFPGFSSASPPALALTIGGFALLFWLLARAIPRPRARSAEVWTSGESYRPWTQYTGTGFANPSRVILDAGMRTTREIAVEGPPHGERSTRYSSAIRPFFDLRFYRRVASGFLRVADIVRKTQSGAIAAYLSYILVFTILLLLLFPSIRKW